MSNMDYTQYSSQPVQVEVEEVEKVVEEPVVEVEQPIVETEAKLEPVKQKMGVVVDCAKLNVRERPNKNAQVVCRINAATNLVIDEKESTVEYYKVCTEAGVEGYCMKKFITVL